MSVIIPTGQSIETTSPDATNLRQVINVGDPATTATAKVETADPASTDAGLIVRDVRGNAALPVRVDPTGTTVQPVSGTVTANVGTTNGLALDTSLLNPQVATGTTAPTKILIVGGKTNDVTPQYQPVPLTAAGAAVKVDGSAATQPVSGTLTVTQATAANLKVDLSGTGANATALKVDGSAVTQPISGTVTSNQGTPAALANAWPAKLTDGTNAVTVASLTNSKALAVEIVDGAGTQITSFGGGTQFADGATSATPTGTVALGKNPTNILHALALDASGNLNVNVVAGGTGGNASVSTTGTAVPADATMVGGSDGVNLKALLVDASGFLKVNVAAGGTGGNASVSTTGTAVPADATMVGATDGTNLRALVVDSVGTLNVATPDLSLSTTVAAANAHSTALNVSGRKSFAVDVRGTWTGQLIPEVSINGTDYLQVDIWDESLESWINTNITANGMWWFEPLGVVKSIRMSATAATWTGTANITLLAGMGDMNTPEFVGAAGSTIPNNIAQVGGSDGTHIRALSVDANGRPFAIPHDGTNQATIKAASTAPTGADTALVVAVSPNTPALVVNNSIASNLKVDISGTGANSAALLVTDAGLELTQATTTSGQKGPLVQGAVTTAPPAYTTGQTNPLSLTTAGALRIDGSGVTQPISGTITVTQGNANTVANAWPTKITDGTNSAVVKPASTAPVATDPALVVSLSGNSANINVVQAGTWTVQPGNTANTTPWLVSQQPATTGGLSGFRLISAASTNATNVKASAGQLYGWYIANTSAAFSYVVLYNTATAPTPGTTAEFLKIGIPAGAAANVFTESGIAFSTGISIATVTGPANLNSTAVAANDLIINLFYK